MFRPVTAVLTALLSVSLLTTSLSASASRQGPPVHDPPQLEVETPSGLMATAFREVLAARRAEQIARLEKYLEDGMFPRNRDVPFVTNIFRDADGLLCAIAFLINEDGLTALVDKTARENNQVRIGELKAGPLLGWVATSGLTQEEVAMVQLPDSPMTGGRDWFLEENRRIRSHMVAAIAALKKNNEASLDLATKRLLERVANG